MSLNAYVWASNLPLDVVSATGFRALLKYADRVDEYGRAAWFTSTTLAESLGCSTRTAQRAVRELLDLGLLFEGDQRLVKHIRGGARPTVYDINLTGNSTPTLDGRATTTVDVADESSYDRSGPSATTTVVAHRTVSEPYKDLGSNQGTGSYDKSVVARSAYGVQPAPKYPRLADQAITPPKQPMQPPEQIKLNEAAAALRCPEGFGDSSGSLHLIPATLTGCARCGTEAATILDQAKELTR